jgi:hypothetical protein
MKKAILIDSINRKIEETTIDLYTEIAPAIGCEWFTTVQISGKETLFVDDEGLLKNPEHFFVWEGYPQPLAGSGLILGLNPNTGESVSTKLTIEQVKERVTFLP